MRKYFGLLIFILVLTGGVFSPVLGVKKSEASMLQLINLFVDTDEFEFVWDEATVAQNYNLILNVLPNNFKLYDVNSSTDLGDTFVSIKGKIQLDGEFDPPADDPDNGSQNRFDSEDSYGVWGDILSGENTFPEKNHGDGFFLEIGKELEDIPLPGENITTGNGNQRIKESSKINFLFSDPAASDPTFPVEINYTGSPSNPKANNIGYYIWGQTSKQEEFFTKNTFELAMGITGLDAGQQYYARLFAYDDSSDAYIATNIISFTTPATTTLDQNTVLSQQTQSSLSQNQQGQLFGELFRCKWNDWTISHCIAELFYEIFYTFSHWLLALAGGLFDFFVGFSLSNKIYDYNSVTFIGDGWRVVRDLSNIFFIFILMYAAIGLILKLHHFDAKSVIAKVIMIGLLVNFSLFFTRIVIDASNILARVFYNEITIQTAPQDVTNSDTGIKIQSLSAGIVQGMDVGSIVNEDTYNALKKEPGGINASTLFLITMLGIIVNVITAWTFLNVSMYFIGRILGLWFAMIFAPLAFVTNIVPSLGSKLPKVGWKEWVKNLTDLAIMAPIFVFFMFLIISFLGSSFISTMLQDSNGASFAEVLISIILQFMLVIGLLQAAKNTTKKLSGEFGESVAGIASGAAKFVGGAALGIGAAGFAGVLSRTRGASAMRTLESDKGTLLKKAAAGDARAMATLRRDDSSFKGMSAKQIQEASEKKVKSLQARSTKSYDIRNSQAGNLLTKATGVDMNAFSKIPGMGRLSAEQSTGGYKGAIDRKTEERKKFIESLGHDEKKIHELEEEKDEAENKAKEARNNADRAGTGTFEDKTKEEWKAEAGRHSNEANSKEKEIKDEKKKNIKSYAAFLKQQYDPNTGGTVNNNRMESYFTGGGALNTLKKALRSAVAGGVAGAFAGPIGMAQGAIVGAVAGLTNGGILKGLRQSITYLGRAIDNSAQVSVPDRDDHFNMRNMTRTDLGGFNIMTKISQNIQNSHYKAGDYKTVYKSPNNDFFKIFESLGKTEEVNHGGTEHDTGGGGHH